MILLPGVGGGEGTPKFKWRGWSIEWGKLNKKTQKTPRASNKTQNIPSWTKP